MTSPQSHHPRRRRLAAFRLAMDLLIVLVGVLGATEALATELVPLSLSETVRQSEAIVLGTIQDQQSRWGDGSHRWMVTDYTLAVEKVLHSTPGGDRIGETVVLTYWGGTLDGSTQTISDLRAPRLGERLVVMLRPDWQRTVSTPVVGFNQGLLGVSSETKGGPELVRNYLGEMLAQSADGQVAWGRDAETTNPTAGSPGVDLPRFESWLRLNLERIQGAPSELAPPASLADPRVSPPRAKSPDLGARRAAQAPAASRSVIGEGADAGGMPAPRATAAPAAGEQEGLMISPSAMPEYSTAHQARLPIVVNNLPDSFTPWSPQDEFQMAKWNYYATEVFRVYTTPTGTYSWPDGRFDLAGWPSSSDLQRVYGYSWEPGVIGVTFLRYDGSGWIVEADIALNPAFGFTLDDEWIYDGSSAQGFRHVMIHELGHMHGLEHQFNFLSVMNYMPSVFRAFAMPYMDDAAGIRFEYPGNTVSVTDLAVYLYYASGYQSVTDATIPSSVPAGGSLSVNNYHVENVGVTTIGTPTIEWYLTTARNFVAPYYFLGNSSYSSLPPFTYFTPSTVSRSFTVPASVPAGDYFLGAYIRGDGGAGQSSFPFDNNRAFSRRRITVTSVPKVTVVATDANAAEPANPGTFTFSRTGPTGAALTASFAVTGTAVSGTDYASIGTSVVFGPGASTATKTVTPIDNAAPEGLETVIATVISGNGYTAGTPSTATITIQDNDGTPTLQVDDVSKTEGSAGTTPFTFTVSLSSAAAGTVKVNYATAAGTAAAPSDFAAASGTLTFTPGQTTKTVTVNVVGDTLAEPNETFVVNLSAASGATIADNQGAGTILDDDGRTLSIKDLKKPEGNAANTTFTFKVRLSSASAAPVSVKYATAALTATAPADFAAKNGTLTFNPGETLKKVKIKVVGDTTPEPNETFLVNLSGASGASIADAQAVGTIVNDDCAGDADGDRLCDAVETNTGVYVNATNTGTNPANPDTDGDGIRDGDEVLGTIGGLNLPAMGTNPLKKNILLEYDWFNDSNDCGAHSHRPTQAYLDRVSAAFAASTNTNPDGTTGIKLINDFGQGGAFTGGNLIADADGNITGGVNGADFNAKKTANFAANRNGYFHYVIVAHLYTEVSGSSGQAELPGDDLIVSLQCFESLNNTPNTIMHELGHNLGLRHGGNENCNWKPNYNSVMNYRFQFPGVDTSCNAVGSDGESNTLNYSLGARIALNENTLNETRGSCGSTPIDWNFVGGIQSGIVYDLNRQSSKPNVSTGVDNSGCASTLSTLRDFNDWANITFTGLTDGDGAQVPWSIRRSVEIIDCDNPPPEAR